MCEIVENALIQLSEHVHVMVDIDLSLAERCYQVGRRYKLLLPAMVLVLPMRGHVKQVRIVPISKGQLKTRKVFLLYSGVTQVLIFDLVQYYWLSTIQINMAYLVHFPYWHNVLIINGHVLTPKHQWPS